MEYIDLIRRFWQMNYEFPQNSSVTNVYLFLLENWDKNKKTDFEFSDTELSTQLRLSRNTIKNARKALRDLGLISCRIVNGLPVCYKIITDYTINRKIKEPEAPTPTIVAEKEKEPIPVPVVKSIPVVPKARKAPEIPKMDLPPVAVPTVAPVVPKQVPKAPEMPKTTENNKKDTPTTKDIPTLDEVLNFFKTLPNYEPSLEEHLKTKYEYWVNNGWVSGYNRPITNWQQTVKNTIPYLRSDNKNIFNIPNIKRPKATYDE
jgi:hypothetical protein